MTQPTVSDRPITHPRRRRGGRDEPIRRPGAGQRVPRPRNPDPPGRPAARTDRTSRDAHGGSRRNATDIQDAIASLVRAAELAWTTGLADETFALYDRIIALAPNAVEHRHGVVAYDLQLNRIEQAAAHQRAIIDLSLREGRRHEAIAALHQVIGLTPDDLSAYFQLGDLLAGAGEYGQAERVYRRILQLAPDDPIAQANATAMAALRDQR